MYSGLFFSNFNDRLHIVGLHRIKVYDDNTIELKRIFVKKENRGQGLSKLIVKQIEELARSNEYRFGILQTGRKQIEAIKLYENTGYEIIENYGVYVGDDESVCMKKAL